MRGVRSTSVAVVLAAIMALLGSFVVSTASAAPAATSAKKSGKKNKTPKLKAAPKVTTPATFTTRGSVGDAYVVDAKPGIKLMLNTDYREVVHLVPWRHMVYTGPLDAFFDHCHGRLPYRSLHFEHVTLPQQRLQPVGTINHPNENAYTRVTEFKHLTGQEHAATSLVYEYPRAEGEPYYPVPRPENAALYRRYEAEAETLADVTFVGRLASYRYYNMDQVVAQALATFKRLRSTQLS